MMLLGDSIAVGLRRYSCVKKVLPEIDQPWHWWGSSTAHLMVCW